MTKDEISARIEAARSSCGGRSRDALRALGVAWPPPKGWKERLLGGADCEVEIWFDGSCGPRNPGGRMGWGWHGKGLGWAESESKSRDPHPGNTNNLAEYLGLEAALLFLVEAGLTAAPVVIRGDSQLVIRQMFPGGRRNRRWRIKNGAYAAKARQALSLLERFPNIRGEWVPRGYNSQADALSKGEIIDPLTSEFFAITRMSNPEEGQAAPAQSPPSRGAAPDP